MYIALKIDTGWLLEDLNRIGGLTIKKSLQYLEERQIVRL